MAKKTLLTIFFLLSLTHKCVYSSNWIHVDFETSMGKYNPYYIKHYKDCLDNKDYFKRFAKPYTAPKILELFKKMYEKNNLDVKTEPVKNKIPKIIHQIWIGSALPEEYKCLQKTWIENHPDWEYKLWTDKDLASFEFYTQKNFANAKSFAEKADILRCEILYKFGGLYIDTDFECLKPLNILHENYEFYCGIGPIDGYYCSAKNGLIGSTAKHPILKHYMENMIKSRHKERTIERTGPAIFTRSFYFAVNNLISEREYKNIIALPASYFYPLGVRQKKLRGKKLRNLLDKYPEAFGVHYWDQNWTD